ncbi:hypothetical protein GJU40_03875 [Bacillus lacus]|uniref:Uncharacterized protein n=1 Tax=Metabacillus lacus TaxID=1983721 RepID=A0A7X2IWZ2_9BACI|nr:hypothetical protein [Metabacillus lacus]MRX71310.1 hypothetical protein [Metabacillus lacus]
MLDILLQNPLLIAFLIWVISSVFTRGSRQEQRRTGQGPAQQPRQQQRPQQGPTQQPRQQQPRQGPAQQPRQPQRAEQSAAQRDRTSTVERDIRQRAEQTISQVQEDAKKRYENVKRQSSDRYQGSSERMRVQKAEVVQKEQRKRRAAINGKNAVDGIIWSEILGSPRSRKPHSTLGRRIR